MSADPFPSEQFQQNCWAALRPELRKNMETGRFRASGKAENALVSDPAAARGCRTLERSRSCLEHHKRFGNEPRRRLRAHRRKTLIFQEVPLTIAAVQQREPKHRKNVAETVHLLFKMTSV
jgi:hypothetical protein